MSQGWIFERGKVLGDWTSCPSENGTLSLGSDGHWSQKEGLEDSGRKRHPGRSKGREEQKLQE